MNKKSNLQAQRFEGMCVVLPFVAFYTAVLATSYWTNHSTQTTGNTSELRAALTNVTLQNKDTQFSRVRATQLKRSYERVLVTQRALEQTHTPPRLTQLASDHHNAVLAYDIVALESDDSVFAVTQLPNTLPLPKMTQDTDQTILKGEKS